MRKSAVVCKHLCLVLGMFCQGLGIGNCMFRVEGLALGLDLGTHGSLEISPTSCESCFVTPDMASVAALQAGTRFGTLNTNGDFTEKVTNGMWIGVGHEHWDVTLDFEGSNSMAKDRTAAFDAKLMMAAFTLCPVLLWCIAAPDGSAISSTFKDNLSTLFQASLCLCM